MRYDDLQRFCVDHRLQVQLGLTDFSRFQRVIKLVGMHPFKTAENALENINAVSEHEITDDLRVRIVIAPDN